MLRTVSRDKASPRSVLVWPDGVTPDQIKTSVDGVHFAKNDADVYYTPAIFPADVFKHAFGRLPKTGTVEVMEFDFHE